MEPLLTPLDEVEIKRISATVRKGGLGREMYPWNGLEPMLRLQARLGAPKVTVSEGRDVVIVTPVTHFEVNVVPLVLKLTRKSVAALVDFFSLPDEATLPQGLTLNMAIGI